MYLDVLLKKAKKILLTVCIKRGDPIYAGFLFEALCFFRSLPRSLMKVVKLPHGNLLEILPVRPEILLCRSNLHTS